MSEQNQPNTELSTEGDSQSFPPPEFALEEYKQVLEERRTVLTRYVQAVGFYLALSGFGLRELVTVSTPALILGSSILFSILNVLAFYVAIKFRSMAKLAAQREEVYVNRYHLQRAHELLWGYKASLWLVILNEATIVALVIWKVYSKHCCETQW